MDIRTVLQSLHLRGGGGVCVGGAGACERRVHGNSGLCVCVWVYVCQCWKVCAVEMGVEGGGGIT